MRSGVLIALGLAASLAVTTAVAAELLVSVPTSSAAFAAREPELLGSVPVPGLGEVRLRAQREGNRVVIQALKADDSIVGRAEGTAGLAETPIFVNAPGGLQKILVRWGGQ